MQTPVLDPPVAFPAPTNSQSGAQPRRTRRTGRGVAIAGAACLALGLIFAITLFALGFWQISRVANAARTMPRASAPGSDTVALGRGKQFIWIETDKDYAVAKPDVTISVTKLRTEEQIPVTMSSEGAFDGGSAREWRYGTVTIPADASYVIETSGGRSSYAVGFTKVDRSAELIGVGLLFAAIVLGTIFVVIGAAFLPVGLVQMYRSKRAHAS